MTGTHKPTSLSLPTRAVLLLIALVIMISSAVGIPAIWLLHDQMETQAWRQLEQAGQMAAVLIESQRSDLQSLAILTAQRPTLAALLTQDDPGQIAEYLDTLRSGAELDAILICSRGNEIEHAGETLPPDTCKAETLRELDTLTSQGWLASEHEIYTLEGYSVLTARKLDHDFALQMRDQIGLDILLGSTEEISSLESSTALTVLETVFPADGSDTESLRAAISLPDNSRWYTLQLHIPEEQLDAVVLLPAEGIDSARQEMTRIGLLGILLVALAGSGAAVILTRRISRPLSRLRDSAFKLRKGDLDSAVHAPTRLREIAEVAYSLEDARISLRHSLEQLKREKAWSDYLLESVVEGIITLDRFGRITFFSRGSERITGWAQDRVVGKNVDEVFIPADREHRFSELIPPPKEKPNITVIAGRERSLTLAVSGAQVTPPEAGIAETAFSIRDISSEEAMRGLLGEFLANITHEFRTPLTAQAASIELLLDQLPELTLDEIRELLQANHIGVLSLQNLIDNLLEGASIEAGRFKVHPHPSDLPEIILRVTTLLQPLAEKREQNLALDIPESLPPVMADSRRTEQVLVNLLSNAFKWSPHASTIRINANQEGSHVRCSVADQGPGIQPSEKQNLFIPFGHMNSSGGRAEYGAGLGLSVVKAIVETQGGSVGAENSPGGGTIFWFTIPTTPAGSEEHA